LNKNICSKAHPAGTDVTIFKLFSAKNLVKIFAFFAQTTAGFCKNIIITLVFEKKNTNFFAENWQKSQKSAIITSTPAERAMKFTDKLSSGVGRRTGLTSHKIYHRHFFALGN
jgi:hypothetical protein